MSEPKLCEYVLSENDCISNECIMVPRAITWCFVISAVVLCTISNGSRQQGHFLEFCCRRDGGMESMHPQMMCSFGQCTVYLFMMGVILGIRSHGRSATWILIFLTRPVLTTRNLSHVRSAFSSSLSIMSIVCRRPAILWWALAITTLTRTARFTGMPWTTHDRWRLSPWPALIPV